MREILPFYRKRVLTMKFVVVPETNDLAAWFFCPHFLPFSVGEDNLSKTMSARGHHSHYYKSFFVLFLLVAICAVLPIVVAVVTGEPPTTMRRRCFLRV